MIERDPRHRSPPQSAGGQRIEQARSLVRKLRAQGWEPQADEYEVWMITRIPLDHATRMQWRELSAEVHAVVMADQRHVPRYLDDHPSLSPVEGFI